MTEAETAIRAELEWDIVSYSEIRQACGLAPGAAVAHEEVISDLLNSLLSSDVAIGRATAQDDYVRFTAWSGSTKDKVERAIEMIRANGDGADADFGFWLALQANIDGFEAG